MTYKIIFLRHAECLSVKLAAKDLILQNPDNALTEKGQLAAKKKAELLKETFEFNNLKIYCSPIRRARETAIYLEELFEQKAVIADELMERKFNFPDTMISEDAQKYQVMAFNDPYVKVLGGESVDEHYKRVQQWAKINLMNATSDIIVVAHGGTFDLLQNVVMNAPVEVVKHYFTRLDLGHYHLWSKMLFPAANGYVWRLDGVNL